MPRGQMTTETKDELRQRIDELERDLEAEITTMKDQQWALRFLGITANVEKEPELFKQQVVFTAYKLGRLVKQEQSAETTALEAQLIEKRG